jgi:acetyl esterase
MTKYFIIVIFACLFKFMEGSLAQSPWDMSAHEIRDLINRKILAIKADRPNVQNVNDITIKCDERTTSLRVYTPNEDEHLPIILFIHGGAWVAGNLETHDNMARYLSREVKALVVSVEYLNSPEGKFPIPLEQCYDALLWIVEHALEFHADISRLAVIGDSAGGNMAAALCLLTRDRQGPSIDLQVLVNPSPDLTGGGSIQRQDDALDPLRWYAKQYVMDPSDVNNLYVSPIMAKDLCNLPSALVILAENDELRRDGKRYADRLSSDGVTTNIYTQWGIGHLAGNGARASIIAQESLDVAVAALRGTFIRKALNQTQLKKLNKADQTKN